MFTKYALLKTIKIQIYNYIFYEYEIQLFNTY